MTHETFEALAAKAGNPRIAPQYLPAARISPVTVESGAADYGLGSSVLELVSHVRVHGDQAARVEVEQYLGEVVLAWLRCHPNREVACSFEGKEHYVSLTFERFWQIVAQRQDACERSSFSPRIHHMHKPSIVVKRNISAPVSRS
jgi:hypothetical protein